MSAAIRAEGLTKHYPPPGRRRRANGELVVAVRGVSFDVEAGEIFGLLGPNGAGKTTTLLMLCTLLAPTSGSAAVAGRDVVREAAEVRRSIGYVAQEIAVDDLLTGRENLLLQGRLFHMEPGALRKRVEELLVLFDLTARADDRVATYSGGMRKRIDLAAGLVHRPPLLILDEPTLGLDLQTRQAIWDYIRRLRGAGHTILLTTHYMEEADQLCDRVAIMDRGAVKALGPPGKLKADLGGDLVRVRLSPPEARPRFEEALEGSLPGATVAAAGDFLHIGTADGERAVGAVVEAARRAGAEVESLTVKRPTLDDVFLHHTGREMRDAGAEEFLRMREGLRRARG
ncbi:MAG: ATP-binding cassette domain-containing protein [Halobacteria archaeon]